jgi:peptidoglycan/LPS O-acetylase OafA/YrhL
MADSKPFFPGIHALRAVASLLIVIEHAGSIDHHYTVLGFSYIIPQFSYGRIGVVLFFAISGFVIALQRDKPVSRFIWHRFLRIYPTYWFATAVSAVLLGLAGMSVSVTFASMLLYPSTAYDPTSTIPYWTLIFEVTFYVLACIVFALRLSDRTLAILAVTWILAVNFIGNTPSEAGYCFPGAGILLSPEVQVFPIGLICGIYFDALKRAGRWPYVIAGVLAFAWGTFLQGETAAKLFAMGIYSSCAVVAIADLDLRSRIIRRLGDASYGIYLMHFAPMHVLSVLYPHPGDAAFFVVGTAFGVGFGLFDHWLYKQLTAITSPKPEIEQIQVAGRVRWFGRTI